MMQTYCPYCLKQIETSVVCPHCGQALGAYQSAVHHFPPGGRLKERYVVGRVLGEGGFGITYLGLDNTLGRRVAIKEYFPTVLVHRESSVSLDVTCYTDARQSLYEKGRDQFLQEARLLAKLDEIPEIVHVLDFFPANNTAYIVMEYLEGETLSSLLSGTGRIPAKALLELLEPVLRAMESMHAAGIIHRDISPDNMIQLKNGQVKLLDFGCARDTEEGQTLTVMLKHGYAPIEQYTGHNQGPWTDVYAVSATIYRCLTGKTPPKALERGGRGPDPLVPPTKLGAAILPAQEQALLKGLAPEPEDRWQSISGLYAPLYGTTMEGFPWVPEAEGEKTELLWDSKQESVEQQTLPLAIGKQEDVPEAAPTGTAYLPNDVRTPELPRIPSSAQKKLPIGIAATVACCVIAVAAVLGWKYFAPPTVSEVPEEQVQDEAPQELDEEQSQGNHEGQLETMSPEKISPQGGDEPPDEAEPEVEPDEPTDLESEVTTNSEPEQTEPVTTATHETTPAEQEKPAEIQQNTSEPHQETAATQTTQEPETEPAQEPATQAEPEGVTWNLENGTLTISGKGRMDDYANDGSQPWYKNRDNIRKVIIENGVTSIGAYAFNNCTNITNVTIPDGVTSIGERAFRFCGNLTSISMPSSMANLGAYAFEECRTLASATLPVSITSIQPYTFYRCSSLANITIPSNVTNIGEGAFHSCTGLTSITIPSKVTSIGDWAFCACGLTSVSIPDNVISIGNSAFQSCSHLVSVTIPNSITRICKDTFFGCGLTSITIPSSVTSIGDGAFSYCTNLTNISIPDGVTSIGSSAFCRCLNLTNVTIPDSMTSIGKLAFSVTGVTSIVLPTNCRYVVSAFGTNCSITGGILIEG